MTDYGPYTAEEGTAGATVTTGGAFDNIVGAPTYSATGKEHSSLGYRWQQGTAAAWRAYKTLTSTTQLACRVGFTLNSMPGAARELVWVVNAAFGSNARFGIDSTGKPQIKNASGTVLATGAAALTAGTNYVVEIQTAPGTGTTDGTIKCQVYAVSAPGTLLLNYSASNVSAGSGSAIIRGQVGSNTSETIDITFDDILWRTNTLTAVGPYSTAPTANAGSAQSGVEPYSTVTLDGSGSTAVSPNTISSYAWTQTGGTSVTLTGAATVSPTFTAPATRAGDTLTFQLVVADNLGQASAPSTVTIGVLPHTIWQKGSDALLHPVVITQKP